MCELKRTGTSQTGARTTDGSYCVPPDKAKLLVDRVSTRSEFTYPEALHRETGRCGPRSPPKTQGSFKRTSFIRSRWPGWDFQHLSHVVRTPVAFAASVVSSQSPHGPGGPWEGDDTEAAEQAAEQAPQDPACHRTRAYCLLSSELRCKETRPWRPLVQHFPSGAGL